MTQDASDFTRPISTYETPAVLTYLPLSIHLVHCLFSPSKPKRKLLLLMETLLSCAHNGLLLFCVSIGRVLLFCASIGNTTIGSSMSSELFSQAAYKMYY